MEMTEENPGRVVHPDVLYTLLSSAADHATQYYALVKRIEELWPLANEASNHAEPCEEASDAVYQVQLLRLAASALAISLETLVLRLMNLSPQWVGTTVSSNDDAMGHIATVLLYVEDMAAGRLPECTCLTCVNKARALQTLANKDLN